MLTALMLVREFLFNSTLSPLLAVCIVVAFISWIMPAGRPVTVPPGTSQNIRPTPSSATPSSGSISTTSGSEEHRDDSPPSRPNLASLISGGEPETAADSSPDSQYRSNNSWNDDSDTAGERTDAEEPRSAPSANMNISQGRENTRSRATASDARLTANVSTPHSAALPTANVSATANRSNPEPEDIHSRDSTVWTVVASKTNRVAPSTPKDSVTNYRSSQGPRNTRSRAPTAPAAAAPKTDSAAPATPEAPVTANRSSQRPGHVHSRASRTLAAVASKTDCAAPATPQASVTPSPETWSSFSNSRRSPSPPPLRLYSTSKAGGFASDHEDDNTPTQTMASAPSATCSAAREFPSRSPPPRTGGEMEGVAKRLEMWFCVSCGSLTLIFVILKTEMEETRC